MISNSPSLSGVYNSWFLIQQSINSIGVGLRLLVYRPKLHDRVVVVLYSTA